MSPEFSRNPFSYDPSLMPSEFEQLRSMHDVVLAGQFAQFVYSRSVVAETADDESAVRAASAGLTQKIGSVTIGGLDSLASGMSHEVEATFQEFFGARSATYSVGRHALVA